MVIGSFSHLAKEQSRGRSRNEVGATGLDNSQCIEWGRFSPPWFLSFCFFCFSGTQIQSSILNPQNLCPPSLPLSLIQSPTCSFHSVTCRHFPPTPSWTPSVDIMPGFRGWRGSCLLMLFSVLLTSSLWNLSFLPSFYFFIKKHFFFLFTTAPMAYGSFWARDGIGAIAADLRQSHIKVESEPHLWPTLQLAAMPDP